MPPIHKHVIESKRISIGQGGCNRSRQKLWRKGEESGHHQDIQEIRIDCDRDTIVLKVLQHGAACHVGYRSCFYRKLENGVWQICETKIFDPDSVYEKSK